jgi:hypothetical protein
MKIILPILVSLLLSQTPLAQTAITAVTTSNSASTSTTTYTNGGFTYNWGLSPDNTTTSVNGFTAGGLTYSYASFLNGFVKLRRVNNAVITGIFTLVWAETVTSGTNYNMLPAYQNDMESFFDNRIYNQGTDNLFDNTSSNSNNIERLDWILPNGFSTPSPSLVGFAVFERGAVNAHDQFCIAAITSLDAMGNPASYGSIVRVTTAQYGDPGPSVSYRILKATYPNDLISAGNGTQNRGGVIISLQNLGISANTTIYGYSLMAADLPVSATPADLVNFNNITNFPTNTGNPGGIDLIAVTGIYIENVLLPTQKISLLTNTNNGVIEISWTNTDEINTVYYEIERSNDGIRFNRIANVAKNVTGQYRYTDILAKDGFYRIKAIMRNGGYQYSAIQTANLLRTNGKLYPVPATNDLHLQLYSADPATATLTIIGQQGQQILTRPQVLQSGNNILTIALPLLLPTGQYTVRLQKDDKLLFTQSFIKQ